MEIYGENSLKAKKIKENRNKKKNKCYMFFIIITALLTVLTGCEKKKDLDWISPNQNIVKESDKYSEQLPDEKKLELQDIYGNYKIIGFIKDKYWYNGLSEYIRLEELDMLMGQKIEIWPEYFKTYDNFRYSDMASGRGDIYMKTIFVTTPMYSVDTSKFLNYALEDSIEPLPSWCEELRQEEYMSIKPSGFEGEDRPLIQSNPEIYVMDQNKLVLFQMGRYFLLERVDGGKESLENSNFKKTTEDIMKEVYGSYQIKEFLPTKYWKDRLERPSGPDQRVPQQGPSVKEAAMMQGEVVKINAELYQSYDAYRFPKPEITGRKKNEDYLDKATIQNPEYEVRQIERKEIYGLRDDMLPEELIQQNYIEITIEPGYHNILLKKDQDSYNWIYIPRLYLLDDGRILMQSMYEYFLLQKLD